MLADAEGRRVVVIARLIRQIAVRRVMYDCLDELRHARRDGQDDQEGEQSLRHVAGIVADAVGYSSQCCAPVSALSLTSASAVPELVPGVPAESLLPSQSITRSAVPG